MAITFYTSPISGHAHRVAALLSILELPHDSVVIDLRKGEQRSAEFLAKNPFGQVPLLEDDGAVIADSSAILVYLAIRYDPERRWLPTDPAQAAAVQRWLSVASGELVQGLVVLRRHHVMGASVDVARAESVAASLLGRLDLHLGSRAWLATDHATIADLALYAYVERAEEGRVTLDPFPSVRAWIARVASIDGFVPMARFPPAR